MRLFTVLVMLHFDKEMHEQINAIRLTGKSVNQYNSALLHIHENFNFKSMVNYICTREKSNFHDILIFTRPENS